jgi:phosphatidylglycerol lysyltransferase
MQPRDFSTPDGCAWFPNRSSLDPARLQRAEQLAFQYGEAYDSYLLLQDGLSYFFSSDGNGVVGFTRWNRHLYVVGGLLASPESRSFLLNEFLEFARRNRLEASFLNTMKPDVDFFRDHGFAVSKVGEEPVIDLQTTTWAGKDFAWVRRQVHYCERHGVTFREVDADRAQSDELELVRRELEEVSSLHVCDTVYGRELSVMVGKLDLDAMFRRRLFIGSRQGRIEAFVIATPSYDGQMWSVETFRRRPDATRGIITYLIYEIARTLQAENVPAMSLCQVPALRVKQGTPSDSRFVVNGLDFWYRRLPWFYDVPRLYHFKSRFRPSYRECFIATYPKSRCIPLLALFFKWGIIWPSFARLPMQMLRRIRKWSHVEKLADPKDEHVRLIEGLPVRVIKEVTTPIESEPTLIGVA